MSIGSLPGVATSVAGTSLAQTKGSEIERGQQDTASQDRRVQNDIRADAAAGVGATDGEDHETAERDGDGRRPWEEQPEAGHGGAAETRQSKDPTQHSGNLLDLTA
jgi:hypothetical protein